MAVFFVAFQPGTSLRTRIAELPLQPPVAIGQLCFGIRNDPGEKWMLFAPQRGVRMPRRAGLMLRRKSETPAARAMSN